MSLRKSPELTPQLLDAARHNAQHSTGPRRPAAKQNSKMNALQHGERVEPANHFAVMRALGEDPQQFADLKQELRNSFGPGEALWERQIDDLARLYWRRQRLERAQTGRMRRALQGIEEWQHRRQQEMAGATFDSPQAIETQITEPSDPGVRLRLLLSFLGVVREQVKQRLYKPRQRAVLESLYHNNLGWRQGRLCFLLYLFEQSGRRLSESDEVEEFLRRCQAGDEQAGEPQYQELLRLLEEEMAAVQEELQYAEKRNEERVAIERDACLAPAGDEWRMMLRREETLDRAIDRKIKMLLGLRKEAARPRPPAPDQGEDTDNVSPTLAAAQGSIRQPMDCPGSESGQGAPKNKKMHERSGNVTENTQGAGRAGLQSGRRGGSGHLSRLRPATMHGDKALERGSRPRHLIAQK
jgi:DNA-binding transcriptional MerR regulator